MNAHYSLELAVRDILRVIKPTRDDWSIRFRIIEEVRAVVLSIESFRGATVEPFGSFVSNLFTRWGDLDISVEIPNGSHISSAGKKHKQSLLRELLKALKRKGGFHALKFISHARIPILKCESNWLNISCDISINNLNGQMKSKLLFWINEIDGRFCEMVLLVKEWAKAHYINDSKSGSLNSYSLSLLIIFHFQTCQPAILPPLKEIYPGNMVDDLTGVRTDAEKHVEEICAVNINRIKSDRSRRINQSSLSELFVSFLAKFCDISARASGQGISPYNGQWEDIGSNMIWQPKTYALFVEDPFEQPINTARSVSRKQLSRITDAFQITHQMLSLTDQNQNFPMDVIVRPEVLQIMGRTPIGTFGNNGRDYPGTHPQLQRNPNNNGVNHHIRTRPQVYTHPNPSNNGRDPAEANRNSINNGVNHPRSGSQVHRARHPPILVQQWSQSNTNNSVHQRPAQAARSQGHQIWRPRSEK